MFAEREDVCSADYSHIERMFLELDALIVTSLSNRQGNHEGIKQKFKDLKELIDLLEVEDEEKHAYFLYGYHYKYFLYLKNVGQQKEAEKYEKLAEKRDKFKQFWEKTSVLPDNTRAVKTTILEDKRIDEFFICSDNESEFLRYEKDILEQVELVLEETIIKEVSDLLNKIHTQAVETFPDYQEINAYQSGLNSVLNEAIIRLSDEDNGASNKNKMIEALNTLRLLAEKKVYQIRINFVNNVLVSADPGSMLFYGVVQTEENIKKRYKQLSLTFHPDKFCPLGKHESIISDMFGLIKKTERDLLLVFEKASAVKGKFVFHEERANAFWELAQEYKNARERKWDKLKTLKVESILNQSSEELDQLRADNIRLAIEEYRACCKIADKNSVLKEQIKLRGKISLCFYVLKNCGFEAQLYALAAIKLIINFSNSKILNEEDLLNAKKILDKVQGINSQSTMDVNSKKEGKEDQESSLPLITIVSPNKVYPLSTKISSSRSFSEKQEIDRSIDEQLKKMTTQLILKSDRSLVKYQTPQEEILHAKKRGRTHKAAGITTMTAGVGVGGIVAVSSGYEILQAAGMVAGVAVGGPVFAVVFGISTIGLGIWGGVSLWKKGNEILQEPQIRENLNNILVRALKFYDAGRHQEFIQELAQNYTVGKSLIKLTKSGQIIDAEGIITSLGEHGFRPDGIAYLLNVIGETLSTGKVMIEGLSSTDLSAKAKEVFFGVLNEKLIEDANKLDKRIREIRKGSIKSYLSTLQDSLFLKDYSNIAIEHVNDAQEMPFKSRLEEMRNIAKMNVAVIRILNGGDEELKLAQELIEQVRNSINSNYQFISKAKSRFEVLEDFMWVVSGKVKNDEDLREDSDFVTPEVPLEIADKYLESLNASLEKIKDSKEKMNLYNKKAMYYEQKAIEEEKRNHLRSLCDWKEAQKNYQEALKCSPGESVSAIGFARSLLKLSKYTQVINFLKENKELANLPEYWIVGSVAYRKKNDYKMAESFIVEALQIDPKNKVADEQRKLIQALKARKEQGINIYRESKILQEETYLSESRRDERPFYKILSIDGGGIRGVLPALWLSEIERKKRRPISHLFNMVSGTSTGGIIAAGLSAPLLNVTEELVARSNSEGDVSFVTVRKEIPSLWQPRYSASDILDLYLNKSQNIFTASSSRFLSHIGNLKKAKYTDNGRFSLFNQYFGNTRLSHALTDIVIPAVSENHLLQSHFFNRYDSINPDKNDSLVDVLMATTAAPTFFPSYKIRSKGIFIDGGVHVNNPATSAYHEAIRYKIPKDKIFVFSIGTGAYVPEPLAPDLYRGQLFWAQNLHKVALSAQEGNTDIQMYQELGSRYQRWQVWFEEPIALDDFRKESLDALVDMGNQYIEDLYDSDANTMNSLLEFLEEDVPKGGASSTSCKPDTAIKSPKSSFGFKNNWYNNDEEQPAFGTQKSTASETERSSNINVNTAYQYEDNDIQAILVARLQQLRIKNLQLFNKPVEVLAAVDNIRGVQLESRLRQEAANNQGARMLLIPCNLGNAHWVGILLEFGENGTVSRAEYLNSLTTNPDIPETFQVQLQRIYPNMRFQPRMLLEQSDYTSCGAYTIENLLTAALGIQSHEGCEATRRLHLNALRQYNPTFYNTFYDRQRNNRPTIATLQEQLVHLDRLQNIWFSKPELNRILAIKQCLSRLPEEAKTILFQAFQFYPAYNDKHVLHLNTIRVALQKASMIESKVLTELMELLFEMPSQPGMLRSLDNLKFRVSYEEVLAITQRNLLPDQMSSLQQILAEQIKQDEEFAKKLQAELWSHDEIPKPITNHPVVVHLHNSSEQQGSHMLSQFRSTVNPNNLASMSEKENTQNKAVKRKKVAGNP